MLTPAQIKSHRFISAVRGTYKADDVDNYFEEVSTSYDQAFKENAELIKKIGVLAERLEAYRNDEDNIKSTLLTAQRMADSMIREANETSEEKLKSASEKLEYTETQAKMQAQVIIDDANKNAGEKLSAAETKVKQIIDDAEKKAEEMLITAQKDSLEQLQKTKDELEKESHTLNILKKEAVAFKRDLLERYKQHIEFIGAINGMAGTFSEHCKETETAQKEDSQTQPAVYEQNAADETENEVPAAEENVEADADEWETSREENEESDFEEQDIELEQDELDEFTNDEAEGLPEDNKVISEDIDEETQKAFDEIKGIEHENAAESESSDEEIDDDEGSPGLFALRQRAMAQQQELITDDGEIEEIADGSASEDRQSSISEDSLKIDTDENEDEDDDEEGFKVYLDRLDTDEDIFSEALKNDTSEKANVFETFEYEDDDDNDSQPKFKGFFKK